MDISTGFNGFTIDVFDGSTSDSEGDVTKAIFAITFPERVNETTVTMSNNAKDWSCLTPMNDYIELYNPRTLYTTPSSAIVKFDMKEKFPSNSQVILCKHNASAKYDIIDKTTTTPFTVNSIEAVMGFTSNEYGGITNIEGETNRVIFNIPFTLGINDVNFEISEGDNDWAALMGDGSYINLKNPYILFTTKSNATVSFAMDKMYPSNSPCILVKRREAAKWTITPRDEEHPFIPVSSIVGPSFIPMGERVNLYSQVVVYPMNSSSRNITWKIVEAGGTGAQLSNKSWLTTNKAGTVKIEATIEGGLGKGKNFTKVLTINIVNNWITIDQQPILNDTVLSGQINEFLSVLASTEFGNLEYQWYQSTDGSNTAGTPMTNGNSNIFYIPKNLIPGEYYYFCEVRKENFPSVRSEVAHIRVRDAATKVNIFPANVTNVTPGTKVQFSASVEPPTADEGQKPQWYSSDTTIVDIDNTGMATFYAAGSASISCKIGTITSSIIVSSRFISINNIEGIPATITAGGEINLNSAIITPSNATNKTITWSIINDGNTNATITNDKLITSKPGLISLRAVIKNGSSPNLDYHKDFYININEEFIPVQDIIITNGRSELSSSYNLNDIIYLEGTVLPNNATHQNVIFEINNSGMTEAIYEDGILKFNNSGTCSINAIVTDGLNPGVNFTKIIDININKFIPVEDIIVSPSIYDPKILYDTSSGTYTDGVSQKISYTVVPSNSTMNDVVVEVLDTGVLNAEYNLNTNELYANYDNFNNDITEANISLKLIIKNGLGIDSDYIKSIIIPIEIPEIEYDPISVEDIEIDIPNSERALRPIILDNFKILPKEANISKANIEVIYDNPNSYYSGIPINTPVLLTDEMDSPIYNINSLNNFILYPYEQGNYKVKYSIKDGIYNKETKTYSDFVKIVDINIDIPFIPVNDISNIPTKIPVDTNIVLNPIISSKSYNYWNTTWIEKYPTYENIIININNNEYLNDDNIILDEENKIIKCSNTGILDLEFSIPSGVEESIIFNDEEYPSIPFKKKFMIEVVDKQELSPYPIVDIVGYNDFYPDGNKISLYSLDELSMLCNELEYDYNLTFNDGSSITKGYIEKIKFYSYPDIYEKDYTISIEHDGDTEIKIIDHDKNLKEYIVYNEEEENNNNKELTFSDVGPYSIRYILNGEEENKYIFIIDGILSISDIDELISNYNNIKAINLFTHRTNISYDNIYEAEDIINLISNDDISDGLYEFVLENDDYSERKYYFVGNIDEYRSNIKYNIKKLDSFGSNMILLSKLNMIPNTIYGNYALYNFLHNTYIFDQEIFIPYGIEGNYILSEFLSESNSFNSLIHIPNDVNEIGGLSYFLRDCWNFNQDIILPYNISGDSSFEFFMQNCVSFDRPIIFPEYLNGKRCLYYALSGCTSFNSDVTLPYYLGYKNNEISNYLLLKEYIDSGNELNYKTKNEICSIDNQAIDGFMYSCITMNAAIDIPKLTGLNMYISSNTFATVDRNNITFKYGKIIYGEGAQQFLINNPNSLEFTPFRNLYLYDNSNEDINYDIE